MTSFYVDISHHDNDRGAINFASVRAAGIDVVVAKATEGDPAGYNFTDPKFVGNVTAAHAAGMTLVGGYHCLAHGASASIDRQVNFFIEALARVGGYAKGWALLDVEPFPELKSRGLSPKLSDVVAFETAWRAKTDMPIAIYIPKWYWEEWGSPSLAALKGPLVSSNYPITARQPYATLYAHDGGDHGTGWNAYGGKTPTFWQYASTDAIPGIVGNCDCNAYKGTVAQMVTVLTGKTATPPKPPAPPTAKPPAWPGRVFINHTPQMHGTDIKTWQTQMKKRGWKLTVDGYYGDESMNVCLQFQREKKLHVAHGGQVDKLTWDTSWTAPTT